MTAPVFIQNFRALAALYLWAAYFRPSVHEGANGVGRSHARCIVADRLRATVGVCLREAYRFWLEGTVR